MTIIEVHNEKGGVGCTKIAHNLILGAQGIGCRVTAMSIDPTQCLARELEGSGTPILDPDGDEDAGDLLVVDRNTQCRTPFDADVRVFPIRDRLSWEIACDLSDIYSGSIIWVPSMIEGPIEVPRFLQDIVHVTPAIPRSHAVALADWRRSNIWTDPELAGSAGAYAMRVAVFDILRRALGPRIVVDEPASALPIAPGATVLLRHRPCAGFRVGKLLPELSFGGEPEEGDKGAELELVHLSAGRERALGAWTFGEAPPLPRDFFQHPLAIDVGDGLLLKVTNTGRRPITAARLLVDDDLRLDVPLARRRVVPTVSLIHAN